MKCAVVIVAGLTTPVRGDASGILPLAAARTPTLDRLSRSGQVGEAHILPAGVPRDFCTAALSTLGFDPRGAKFSAGAAAALASRIAVARNELALRCDLVACRDGRILDPQGGRLTSPESAALFEHIAAACRDLPLALHRLRANRGVCVVRDLVPSAVQTTDPCAAAYRGGAVVPPRGAMVVRTLMERSEVVLREHEVNLVRGDLGELPATHLWPWGEGDWRPVRRFREIFGMGGMLVGGDESIRGLARTIGLLAPPIDGADGTIETSLRAKGSAAVAGVAESDVVVVHVLAAALAGLHGHFEAAVQVLEGVDGEILAPLVARLESEREFRVLVVGDPPAGTAESPAPASFVLAGTRIAPGGEERLDPAAAARSGLVFEAGWEMLEYVLRGARRASTQR